MRSVIIALILREMATRFGRSPGGYLWAVLEPVAVLALLSLIFSQIIERPPLGTSFPLYFATGYLAFHAYADLAQKLGQAIQVNRALLTFPRVTAIDTIIARFLLQTLTLSVVALLILVALFLLEGESPQLDLSKIYLAFALALGLGLSLGFLNAILFSLAPLWERAFVIVTRPLFLISGIFFNLESLPPNLQDLLWFNPLVHITAIARQGFFTHYPAYFVSPPFVIAVILSVLALAVLMFRTSERRLVEM